MKRILITGASSYVGGGLATFLAKFPEKYELEKISLRSGEWTELDFVNYDVIVHVAAIVHKQENPEMESKYYEINTNLTVEIAKKAKEAGVKQFIFMSTMAVYGEDGALDKKVIISKDTIPSPKSLYGMSKLEAEKKLNILNDLNFKVVIVRPPMIYGENCPGNYSKLKEFALKTPIFPKIDNERSMLNISELCKFLKRYIDDEVSGLLLPQDERYINTSKLVQEIAKNNGKKVYLSSGLGWLVVSFFKNVKIVQKMFGNLTYEKQE